MYIALWAGLGLDTLCFVCYTLFYSLLLVSHAYYASKVDLLFSIMLGISLQGYTLMGTKSLYCIVV